MKTRNVKKVWFHIFIWVVVPILVFWALKDISFSETFEILRGLSIWQVIILVLLNAVILLLFSCRWWLLLRGYQQNISYVKLVAYRQGAFAISYFTPGMQFGGEPYQVFMISDRHFTPASLALASVMLDKIFEIIGNFVFLIIGITFIISGGLLEQVPRMPVFTYAIGFLSIPFFYLLAIYAGKRPITWIFNKISQILPRNQKLLKWMMVVISSESEMKKIFKEAPILLMIAACLSGIVWFLVVTEYWLMVKFLGQTLSLTETITALTAARLSFLVPLPGGLGALETSQILAIQAMGYSPSLGLSIAVLIRIRDVLIGLLGLALLALTSRKNLSQASA